MLMAPSRRAPPAGRPGAPILAGQNGLAPRREIRAPVSLGLQPATRDEVDHRRWHKLVAKVTIATVAQGLLAGKYHSGIAAVEVAEQRPDVPRMDERIGAIEDTWLAKQRPSGITARPRSR